MTTLPARFAAAASSWIFSVLLLVPLAFPLSAHAIDWPQQIEAEEGTIVVYQPQPENLQGNTLSGRAAMSLELKGKSEPIFGAFWFSAKIDTDKDSDTVTIHDFKVTKVRWPDSKDADEQRFTAIVEKAVPANGFTASLDSLSASLASAQVEAKSLANLNNKPPKIIFSEELAVLLLFDGEPKFSSIDNSDYERVLNTPFAVVRSKKSKQYFLSNGAYWYGAKDALGPWSPTESPPADLVKLLPADKSPEAAQGGGKAPTIIAAKEPTELISTQGKPDWQSLAGGKLLYVENTESPWLRDLSTNNQYLLLSGRWYRSTSQQGPWTFVPSNELPASFKQIPPDSSIGGLRTSVAGTEEAEDAVLDAQVPQTAAIERSKASFKPEYDGEPKFENIAGTKVAYAVNTGSQVLRIEGSYYAVDAGVWFTAKSAKGPWAVADKVPSDEISKIPPSSPVYNVTYVEIYESTPEVVYVGYTPGYLWSFPYYGAPVYGTGWYYPPYWGGGFYYPRPPTWGFHVGYNPWTGWNVGVSWSNGFFSMGVAWGGGYHGAYRPWGCCGGWHGGYHGGNTIINTGDINIGNNINVGNRTDIRNKFENNKSLSNVQNNLYNRGDNLKRNADPGKARSELKQARPLPKRDNNVFADKSGNVARKVGDQWESHSNGQWNRDSFSKGNISKENIPSGVKEKAGQIAQEKPLQSKPVTPTGRPAGAAEPAGFERHNTQPSFDRDSLNRDNLARQRGAERQRMQPHNMQRPMMRRR